MSAPESRKELVRRAIDFLRGMCKWDGKTYDAELSQVLSQLRAAAPEPPAEILDDSSLRAKVGEAGNQVHNLACEWGSNEKLSQRLGEIASSLWTLARQASPEPPCSCGDRPASQCAGEWEPGCDLGNSERFAEPVIDPAPLPDDAVVERLALWLRGNARILMLATGDTEGWHRQYARDILTAALAPPEVANV